MKLSFKANENRKRGRPDRIFISIYFPFGMLRSALIYKGVTKNQQVRYEERSRNQLAPPSGWEIGSVHWLPNWADLTGSRKTEF